MPRDADDALALDLEVTSVVLGVADKTALLAALDPMDMGFVLDGPDERRGLCRMSQGLLSALVEVQMSGRVSPSDGTPRPPTRTDGAIVGDMLDRWVETAVATAAGIDGLTETLPLAGFHRRPGTVGRRAADLVLEVGSYRTLTVDLSLADGARTGTLVFATPQPGQTGAASGMADGLRRHLPDLPVEMRAILARLPLDMKKARALAPDDVIEVPIGCLTRVRLEGGPGTSVAEGRLGQFAGKKAVRLSTCGADVLPRPMADASALPELADTARSMSDLPELPDVPSATLPDLPAVGALPDLPDLPEPAALPDLPDLPDLHDLPDLPEPA